MRVVDVERRLAAPLVVAVVAASCGGGDELSLEERRQQQDLYFSKHPHAITCDHVLAVDRIKARQFHIAAASLADEVRLPKTNRQMRWARFVYALQDLCKRRRDPGYLPGRDAVRLVGQGKYVLGTPPP